MGQFSVEILRLPGSLLSGNQHLKRDYARNVILPDAETVLALLPKWFDDYNEIHPHSGLRFLSPREFRAKAAGA